MKISFVCICIKTNFIIKTLHLLASLSEWDSKQLGNGLLDSHEGKMHLFMLHFMHACIHKCKHACCIYFYLCNSRACMDA